MCGFPVSTPVRSVLYAEIMWLLQTGGYFCRQSDVHLHHTRVVVLSGIHDTERALNRERLSWHYVVLGGEFRITRRRNVFSKLVFALRFINLDVLN